MAQEESGSGPQQDESNIVSRIGPVEVDWPRSIGLYGGLALAVTMGLIEPPLAIFIGIYPLLKMFNQPRAPRVVRVVSQVLEGAARPVGGDAEGTIRVKSDSPPLPQIKPQRGAARKLPAAAKAKAAPTAKPARKAPAASARPRRAARTVASTGGA